MNTLGLWAMNKAALASGLAIGVSPAVRVSLLDGFAIGALICGACLLVATSPRRPWRSLLSRPERTVMAAGAHRSPAREPRPWGGGRNCARSGCGQRYVGWPRGTRHQPGAPGRGVTRVRSPECAYGPDDLAPQGSLPAAVGIQPQPGKFPVAVLGVIREDSPRDIPRRSARQVEHKVGILRHHLHCARPARQRNRRCQKRAVSPTGTGGAPQ